MLFQERWVGELGKLTRSRIHGISLVLLIFVSFIRSVMQV
jgi:hypothetical protein